MTRAALRKPQQTSRPAECHPERWIQACPRCLAALDMTVALYAIMCRHSHVRSLRGSFIHRRPTVAPLFLHIRALTHRHIDGGRSWKPIHRMSEIGDGPDVAFR